jgi:hypothetical protein
MAGQGTEVTLRFGGRRLLLLNDETWRCRNGGQQIRDMLGRRIQAREPPVQNIRQL